MSTHDLAFAALWIAAGAWLLSAAALGISIRTAKRQAKRASTVPATYNYYNAKPKAVPTSKLPEMRTAVPVPAAPAKETPATNKVTGACGCLSVPNTCGCLDPFLVPALRSGKPFSASRLLELLDSSGQRSEPVSQGDDLDLQFMDRIIVGVPLDIRDGHKATGTGSDNASDLPLRVASSRNINHETSSSVGAVRTVPGSDVLEPTVGDATDTAAVLFPPAGVGGVQDGAAIPPMMAASVPAARWDDTVDDWVLTVAQLEAVTADSIHNQDTWHDVHRGQSSDSYAYGFLRGLGFDDLGESRLDALIRRSRDEYRAKVRGGLSPQHQHGAPHSGGDAASSPNRPASSPPHQP